MVLRIRFLRVTLVPLLVLCAVGGILVSIPVTARAQSSSVFTVDVDITFCGGVYGPQGVGGAAQPCSDSGVPQLLAEFNDPAVLLGIAGEYIQPFREGNSQTHVSMFSEDPYVSAGRQERLKSNPGPSYQFAHCNDYAPQTAPHYSACSELLAGYAINSGPFFYPSGTAAKIFKFTMECTYYCNTDTPSAPRLIMRMVFYGVPPEPPQPAGGELFFPFPSADMQYFNPVDASQAWRGFTDTTVEAVNIDSQAALFAAEGGRVTAVTPAESYCAGTRTSLLCQQTYTYNADGQTYLQSMSATLANTFYVAVQNTDKERTLEYFVRAPVDTLQPFTDIQAGCQLGSAPYFINGSTGVPEGISHTHAKDFGGLPLPILSEYRYDPDPDAPPCGGDDPTDVLESNCVLVNGDFDDALDGWRIVVGTPIVSAGVVRLPLNASIAQNIADLENRPYTLQLKLESAGQLRLALGGNAVSLNAARPGVYSVSLTPDPDLLVQALSITSLSSAVSLDFACIAVDAIATECLLGNPEFREGLQGWNYGNPVGSDGTHALVGDNGYLFQIVTLHPNDDGSPYTYRIEARVRGYSESDPQVRRLLLILDAGTGNFQQVCALQITQTLCYGLNNISTLEHTWTVPPLSYFSTAVDPNAGLLTFDLPIYHETTLSVSLNNDMTSNGTAHPGALLLDSVCIRTQNQEAFPGYTPLPPAPLELTYACDVVPPKLSLNPLETLTSIGAYFVSLYNCEVRPFFESVVDGFQATLDFFSGFASWLATVVQVTFAGFTRWLLNGWLAIWNSPLVLTIRELFMFVFDSLAGVWRRVTQVWQMVTGWIAQLFDLNRWSTLWINSPPTGIAGITNCRDVQVSRPPFCQAIWLLDITLLADGTPGYYGLLVVIGMGALYILSMVFTDIYGWIRLLLPRQETD